jgi:ABC-type nitrate/sulfonate/bicarbonate transport system permease component
MNSLTEFTMAMAIGLALGISIGTLLGLMLKFNEVDERLKKLENKIRG